MPNQLVQFYRQNNPDKLPPEELSSMSDDDITLHYAWQAPDYQSQGIDIFKTYPDFKADYDRIEQKRIQDSITVGDRLKQGVGAFVRGAANTLASVPEAGAIIAQRIDRATGNEKPLEEMAFQKLGKGIEALGEKLSPEVDEEKRKALNESFLNTKVPQGLGSAAGFMAGGGIQGALAKGAARGVAQKVGIAALGAAAQGVEQYKDAIAHGANEDDAFKAFLLGSAVGTSEIMPLSRMLDRISTVVPGGKKALREMLVEAGKETFEEAAQEALQSGAGDLIAKNLVAYDPDRKLFEQMKEDAAVGGVTGFLFSLLTHKIANLRAGGEVADPNKPETAAPPVPSVPTGAPPDPNITGADVAQAAYGIDRKYLTDLAEREIKTPYSTVEEVKALDSAQKSVFASILADLAKKKAETAQPAQPDTKPAEKPSEESNATPKQSADAVDVRQPSSNGETVGERNAQPQVTAGSEEKAPAVDEQVQPKTEEVKPASGGVSPDVSKLAEQLKKSFPEKAAAVDATLKENHPEPPKVNPVAKRNLEYLKADLAAVDESHAEAGKDIEKFGAQYEKVRNKRMEAEKALKSVKGEDRARAEAIIETLKANEKELLEKIEKRQNDLERFKKLKAKTEEAVSGFAEEGQTHEHSVTPSAIEFEAGSLNIEPQQAEATKEQAGEDVSDAEAMVAEGAQKAASANDEVTPEVEETEDEDGEKKPKANKGKKIVPLPGYYEVGEANEPAKALSSLLKDYGKAKEVEDKERIALAIGKQLAAQALTKTGGKVVDEKVAEGSSKTKERVSGTQNSSRTRRVTAWEAPNGKVMVTSTYPRRFSSKKGAKTADDLFRFASDPDVELTKGSHAGTRGIREMLDAGFKPIASMLLRSPRYQVVRVMDKVTFNSEFGHLKELRNEAYSSTISSLGTTATGEYVDSNQLQPDQAVDAEEQNILVEWGIHNVPLIEEMANWWKQQKEASTDQILATFGEKIVQSLAPLKLSNDQFKVAYAEMQRVLPGLIDQWYRKSKRYANPSSKAATEPTTGSSERSDGGDAGDLEGDQQGSQIGSQAPQSEAAPTGASPANAEPAAAEGVGRRFAEVHAELDRMVEDGLISRASADEYHAEVDEARTDEEAADSLKSIRDYELERVLSAAQEEAEQVTRDRLRDPSDLAEVNLATGVVTEPARLPDSPENIIHNIKRLMPKGKTPATAAGLLGQVNLAQLQADYPNLKGALTKIAKDLATKDGATKRDKVKAALAKALADSVDLTGAVLRIIPSADAMKLGGFNGTTAEVLVFPNTHLDESDFQNTILHEALHAYTTRLLQRAKLSPASLTEQEFEFVSKIRSLAAAAKLAGLSWQQSDAAEEVVIDEFIAAAMTDEKFQSDLDKLPAPPELGMPEAKGIWDGFKKVLSKIVGYLTEKFDGLFGTGGAINGSALEAVTDAVNDLIAHYGEASSFLDKQWQLASLMTQNQAGKPAPGQQDNTRYRIAEGLFKDKRDIQKVARNEAMRMMATHNLLGDWMQAALTAWERVGGNRTSTGATAMTFSQFTENMLNMLFRGHTLNLDQARQSINDALIGQGAPAISIATAIPDLEQQSEAPKAQRDALDLMTRVMVKATKYAKVIEDSFGKRNIHAKLAEATADLSEVLNRFDDMTVLTKEFIKELRRSINESEDVGAGSYAKILGITKGRKTALSAAGAWIQSNTSDYADGLSGLADLGLDYSGLRNGTLTALGVNAAIKSSTDTRLGIFSDPAKLALALQFARRRPDVMALMEARRAGEDGPIIRKIIEMAISNRDDAFDQAKRLLPTLKRMGATGQRIIERLREKKAEHRYLMDTVKRYAEWESFWQVARPTLEQGIQDLQRRLQVEGHVDNRQWSAVNGAKYHVPENPSQPLSEVMADKNRVELILGDKFNPAQVIQHAHAINDWLRNNTSLAGTEQYRLMERQADQLLKVYADQTNRQLQRGPGGVIIRWLGDAATRFETTGIQAGREVARMIRKYTTLYEAHLRDTDTKEFWKFDALYSKAMAASGIGHPKEFKDKYYNPAFAYLESRQDLLDPRLSASDQVDKAMRELRGYFSGITGAIKSPEHWTALEALFRQAVRNTDLVQGVRRSMGLKVKDVIQGGRVIFREVIGSPAYTMSRVVSNGVRTLARSMFEKEKTFWQAEWQDPSGAVRTELSKAPLAELYRVNRNAVAGVLSVRFTDDVVTNFVRPLVMKTGKTNFMGPEIGGVQDAIPQNVLVNAFLSSGGAATGSVTGFDALAFAENLHDQYYQSLGLPPDPVTLPDFVGQTMARFQHYANQLNAISSVKGAEPDDAGEIGRAFLDARQGEDFPDEWLDYRTFGHKDYVRYVRIFSAQAAFGEASSDLNANINRIEEELGALEQQYKDAMDRDKTLTTAEREAKLNAGGLRRARMDAAKNLRDFRSARESFYKLVSSMNGAPQGPRTFLEMVGLMAAGTVQGLTTTLTDTITFAESAFRKFGFTKEAVSFLAGSWRNYFRYEALGTLTQAIGQTLRQNIDHAKFTRLINEGGLADHDAFSESRGFKAYGERYLEELGDEMTLAAIKDRADNKWDLATGIVEGLTKRLIKAAKVGMDTGIGVAKSKEQAFATLKLLAPFSMNSLFMHRASARQWLATVSQAVTKAADYMLAHPADMANPAFKFDGTKLGYSGRSLIGTKINDQVFQYLNETLQRNGISLEEAARESVRRGVRGLDALTMEQVHSVLSLAQSEVVLNSGLTTRPGWTMDSVAGRFFAPLIGWSLYKTVDLVKTTRDPQLKASAAAWKNAMTAFVFGVAPVTIAYAMLRDDYEEKVLGKKANVLSIKPDANLPFSLVDNFSRIGAFGIIGEIPNAILNPDTTREFSIDSRVFFASSVKGIKDTVMKLVHQGGTATYESIWRQFLSNMGGSGYLQNFDAINNFMGLDNSERRVIRRINVANQLRVMGREMDMDIRTSRGIVTMPNPVKPWISQMILAAYANDPIGFRAAYQKALIAAQKAKPHDPTSDPYADVAEAYERMHPLRTVFNKAPTTMEYQKILRGLGDDAQEVSKAIGYFNAYGSQIPSKRGGNGLKPYYGTDRSSDSGGGDYRSLITRGSSVGSGYRSLVTSIR